MRDKIFLCAVMSRSRPGNPFVRLGVIALSIVLSLSGCMPAIYSRPAGSTGMHAAAGSLEMTGPTSFVAYTNSGAVGSSMGICEFPDKVGKEFYIEMDIDYPLKSTEQSVSVVFPGGVLAIYGGRYFFRPLPIQGTGVNMNPLPASIDTGKKINAAIYRNGNEAFAYLNNEPIARLHITSPDDHTPIQFCFNGPPREKSAARVEKYSIAADAGAKERYIAIQQRHAQLLADRKEEEAGKKSVSMADASEFSNSRAFEMAMSMLISLGLKAVKETVRSFREIGNSSPVVMSGDEVYVCGTEGLCPARAIEVQGDEVRVRYTSKDCAYRGKMDFSEYRRWVEDPVQWVRQSAVATQSDINFGKFRCN
jgi:hypothetical protein